MRGDKRARAKPRIMRRGDIPLTEPPCSSDQKRAAQITRIGRHESSILKHREKVVVKSWQRAGVVWSIRIQASDMRNESPARLRQPSTEQETQPPSRYHNGGESTMCLPLWRMTRDWQAVVMRTVVRARTPIPLYAVLRPQRNKMESLTQVINAANDHKPLFLKVLNEL